MSENLNMDSFNPKKAELIALANEASKALSVEVVDSKTRQILHEAKMTLANTRVEIRKTWKAMRESAIQWQKDVIKKEDELVNEIEPTEKALAEKIKAYDDAIEAKKEAERKAQEELANNRNQELAKYGYVHDLFDLKIMEEDKFQELLSDKKTAWETVENARIEKENAEKRKNERISTLFSIGMFFNGIVYTSAEVPSISMTMDAVEQFTDEWFAESFDSFKSQIEKAREESKKKKEEQDKRDAELKAREDAIKEKENEQKRIDDEKKRQQDLEDARKKAEKDTEDRIKKEQADKEAREKALADQKAEEAKQEQIKMAKLKKYREFCESIGYKKEEDHLWITKDTPEGREFYKNVGTYLK